MKINLDNVDLGIDLEIAEIIDHPIQPTSDKLIIFIGVPGVFDPVNKDAYFIQNRLYDKMHIKLYGEYVEVAYQEEQGETLRSIAEQLDADIVMVSPWDAEANVYMQKCQGFSHDLPFVPIAEIPEYHRQRELTFEVQQQIMRWAILQVIDWAKGRPFIWIGAHYLLYRYFLFLTDETLPRHRITRYRVSDTLIIEIDPAVGLRDRHFHLITEWSQARHEGLDAKRWGYSGNRRHPMRAWEQVPRADPRGRRRMGASKLLSQ